MPGGSSRLTGKPIGQLRVMTPLARNGPKLRPEVCPLARIPGETFDLSSLIPVVLSGLHAALPRLRMPQHLAGRSEERFITTFQQQTAGEW